MLICRNAATAPGETAALALLPLMLAITETSATTGYVKRLLGNSLAGFVTRAGV